MRIITVNENRSMLDSYEISYKDGNKEAVYSSTRSGAQAAAAAAMDLAISASEYIIFASQKVLDCIPENLRSKK